jgi:hypothetical protein
MPLAAAASTCARRALAGASSSELITAASPRRRKDRIGHRKRRRCACEDPFLHSFDPGVLEHNVRPDMGEEAIIRLDGGPVITFTQSQVQWLKPGQRVRVIPSGSSARVELVLEPCSSAFT